MKESLSAKLRTGMALLALAAGVTILVLRYAAFISVDLDFMRYAAPESGRFGDYCFGAVGRWELGDSFESIAARPHDLMPLRLPYGRVEPRLTVPAGGYLYVRCPVGFAGREASGFGWIELGPLSGPTAVFLNGTKRLEQDDGAAAGFPVLPDDRREAATLVLVARGHADRVSQPGPSSVAALPFFTDDRRDLERLKTYRDSTDRYSLFHLAYALTLLMVFSVAWPCSRKCV